MEEKKPFWKSDSADDWRKNVFFLFLIWLLASVPFLTEWNVAALVLNVGTVLAAWYCFREIFADDQIGLLCCALYTLSVYRIYLTEYDGALGESAATMFLPLILYGMYRLLTEDQTEKSYQTVWILLAVGYAGVLQSHLVSFELTLIFTVFLFLAYLRRLFCMRTLWELCKGALGALLLSALYLWKVIGTLLEDGTFAAAMYSDSIQKRGLTLVHLLIHFWSAGTNLPEYGDGLNGSVPLGVGFLLMACGGVTAILWFNGKLNGSDRPQNRFSRVLLVIGAIFLVMTQEYFPWDHIWMLNSLTHVLVGAIRDPARFLGWGTVCLVTSGGCCLMYWRERESRRRLLTVLLVVGIATSGLYLTEQKITGFRWSYDQGIGLNPVSGVEYLAQRWEGGSDE